jgi:hypothetical protein
MPEPFFPEVTAAWSKAAIANGEVYMHSPHGNPPAVAGSAISMWTCSPVGVGAGGFRIYSWLARSLQMICKSWIMCCCMVKVA